MIDALNRDLKLDYDDFSEERKLEYDKIVKEAELTQYNTGYTKVDIGHGDDPMKYGSVYKDGCGTIHVRSFNYPKISTYETSPDLKGNMEDKNYWDGEFVSEEFLIMDGSARYLRIYRNK